MAGTKTGTRKATGKAAPVARMTLAEAMRTLKQAGTAQARARPTRGTGRPSRCSA